MLEVIVHGDMREADRLTQRLLGDRRAIGRVPRADHDLEGPLGAVLLRHTDHNRFWH